MFMIFHAQNAYAYHIVVITHCHTLAFNFIPPTTPGHFALHSFPIAEVKYVALLHSFKLIYPFWISILEKLP